METHQGKLNAKGLKVGGVVSRFNSFLTDRLLEGALDALDKLGADSADISVFKVPGSFEIPLVAKKLAAAKKVNGIVCLGALVRGDTPHFDYLSAEVMKGLAQLAMEEKIPVSSGSRYLGARRPELYGKLVEPLPESMRRDTQPGWALERPEKDT